MTWLNRSLRVLATSALLIALVSVSHAQAPLRIESGATTVAGHTSASDSARIIDDRSRGYDYLLEDSDRRYPARWCPGEIFFSVDNTLLAESDLDPHRELQRWIDVFDAWSHASRNTYRFSYRGEQKLVIDSNGEPEINSIQPRSIGITYVHGTKDADTADYYAEAVRGRTAGNAGLQVFSSDGPDETALVGDRGFILIDIDDAEKLSANVLRKSLYQHESGHALGLGHVEDEAALMNGTLSRDRRYISDSDAAGLRKLATAPCTRD